MNCPNCKATVFRLCPDGKMRSRISTIVIRKSDTANEAVVESNCPACKAPILLPLVLAPVLEIRKSEKPRFVVRPRA